jgi:hypothetical protein
MVAEAGMIRNRILAVLFATFAAGSLAAGEPGGLVGQVIRMQAAGVSEGSIVRFVKASIGQFDVTNDEMTALIAARVTPRTVKALVEHAIPPETAPPHATGRPFYRGPLWSNLLTGLLPRPAPVMPWPILPGSV